MKLFSIVLLSLFVLVSIVAQGNRVFSGAELINYGIVNISPVNGISWSTERAALPGYFSAVNTATYIGCSDTDNINGYVKKYGNNSFIFPVGNGSDLRTLEISAPSLISDAYATAWILGNPGLDLDPTAPNPGRHSVFSFAWPIVAVSNVGQWDWQVGDAGNLGLGTTGTGAGLTITVSIPDMTLFSPKAYLRLVGWNGTKWIDLSGKATANGNTENSSLSGTMITGITAIGIGRVQSPLALILENFYAISSSCNAVLNWKTSNEINTDLFVVEQSDDGIHFRQITSIKASGSSIGSNYSVTIPQPSGVAYYRLNMKDNDGASTFSELVSCRTSCEEKEYMILYPNPVSAFDPVNLKFVTAYRGPAEFILFNTIGQRMLTRNIEIKEGENFISTDVSDLAAATYFIIVLNADGKQIGTGQKFVRQ